MCKTGCKNYKGRVAEYRVAELIDDEDRPRYVFCDRWDSPWKLIWKTRFKCVGPLACWFQTLKKRPRERVILGIHVPLRDRAARALVRLRIDELKRMCGHHPDFLVNPKTWNMRIGCIVRVIKHNRVRVYKTIAAYAKHLGVTRQTAERKLRYGPFPTDRIVELLPRSKK